jgi:hypothetical protein
MSHSLTYASTTLALPLNLLWVNEFAWQPVAMSAPRYSLTGALIVESAVRLAGRPIELATSDGAAWILRSDLLTLRAWAALPGQTFSLVLRGEAARTVIFDQQAGPIDATPVVDFRDPAPGDPYRLGLRFLEV